MTSRNTGHLVKPKTFEEYWSLIAAEAPEMEDEDSVFMVTYQGFRGHLYKAFHEGCRSGMSLDRLKECDDYRRVFEYGFWK